MKIGVFDSGIGGITVLTALRKKFPRARYVYLGDTAHVPYGTKSPAQIRQLSAAAAANLATKTLDALVVACNTASSLALDEIKASMRDVPVFGVVTAGVQATLEACLASGSVHDAGPAPILVLATRATVRSRIYSRLLRQGLGEATEVHEQECPLLVPMIEEGWLDHPILHQTIDEYVRPHLTGKRTGIALLACTHYPWIQPAFEKALPGWRIVNSANAVAEQLATALPRLAHPEEDTREQGIEWIFTDPDVGPRFIPKEL